MLGRIAPDGEELPMIANGGHWRMAWHPPTSSRARPLTGPRAASPTGQQARPSAAQLPEPPAGQVPEPPPGQPHGANAFCLTSDRAVVLISPDGTRWGWPGGRPEPGESWE